MDDVLLKRVTSFAVPWLRYVLTASEVGRSGQGWLVAAGDDIAIMEAAGGEAAMPIWPYKSLAEAAVAEGTEATSIEAKELMESALPSLVENHLAVLPFPGAGNVPVSPETFARDMAFFAEQRRDVGSELARESESAVMDGPALLETPDMKPEDAGAPGSEDGGEARDDGAGDGEPEAARFWLLQGEDALSVAGARFGDVPALAVFDSRETADVYAETLGDDAPAMVAVPVSVEDLATRWLLLAFSGGWDVAIVTGEPDVGRVSAARLTLDLVEEAVQV